jgi:hypothetical protein
MKQTGIVRAVLGLLRRRLLAVDLFLGDGLFWLVCVIVCSGHGDGGVCKIRLLLSRNIEIGRLY